MTATPMRYLIVEDEQLSADNLRMQIAGLRPEWQCAGSVPSIAGAKPFFAGQDGVDLVFMDIELEDGNCFDLLGEATAELPVIFTTAYSKYALQAFKTLSIDYLLKPVRREELSRALTKYETLRSSQSASPDLSALAKALGITPQRQQPDRVRVRIGHSYAVLRYDDIACVFSESKATWILSSSRGTVLADGILDSYEHRLPPQKFFRISRSCIVNIDAVESVAADEQGKLKVIMRDGKAAREWQVSALRTRKFLAWLNAEE